MKSRLENENKLTFITDDGDEEKNNRRADPASTPELGKPSRRKHRDLKVE